jgi:hypothetical protein
MKYRNTSKIHRSDKKGKSGYTPISNEILQSKTLNPNQKSVLVHLLSLKIDWSIPKWTIYKQMNLGRDASIAAWDRLVELGHIVETPITKKNMMCYHYDIYEEPVPVLLKSSDTGNQSDRNTVSIEKNVLESTVLEKNDLESTIINYNESSARTSILGENEIIEKRNDYYRKKSELEVALSKSSNMGSRILGLVATNDLNQIEKMLGKSKLEEIQPLIDQYSQLTFPNLN